MSLMPTPLVPAPHTAAWLGVARLFAKCESAFPSGFHKHRSALAMVEEALAAGTTGITAGTCGSLGLALAHIAPKAGLSTVIFVPERYRGAQIHAIQELGAAVVSTPGSYEDAVAASAAHARETGLYDANPTGAGGAASLRAYEAIAEEILAQLPGMPDSVWVPVGNGTTLAGIGRGFQRHGRCPRMCGVGSFQNTAAIESIFAGRVIELDPARLRETPENEPLLNWHSAHAAEALAVVRATTGCADGAHDDELISCAEALLRLDGIRATPAAAASLAGLRASRSTGGTHVIVLTA